jgi:hypothetical protein
MKPCLVYFTLNFQRNKNFLGFAGFNGILLVHKLFGCFKEKLKHSAGLIFALEELV